MTQSTSPPPMHCEDPSVALSLSIGLYSSTSTGAKENKRKFNEMNNDGGTNKGSDKNMRIDGEDNKDEKEGSFQKLLDEWDNMSEGQKDKLKKMMGGREDMSGEEAKDMLEFMQSIDSDDKEGNKDYSESNLDLDRDANDDVYYNLQKNIGHGKDRCVWFLLL